MAIGTKTARIECEYDWQARAELRLALVCLLSLEVKGQDKQEQQTKREFLGEWQSGSKPRTAK
jgi:hypothetical protein